MHNCCYEARCTFQAGIGPSCLDRIRCEITFRRQDVWDRGRGTGGFERVRRAGEGQSALVMGEGADSAHGESARASERGLRGVLEAVCRESCLGEDVTLTVVRNGLRVSLGAFLIPPCERVVVDWTIQISEAFVDFHLMSVPKYWKEPELLAGYRGEGDDAMFREWS